MVEGKHLSELLIAGGLYTRNDLKRILATNDSTINTGIFQPRGVPSVLLFVTERKTSDRYQYVDHLDGDELRWEGQAKRGKDSLIIEHNARGLELLLFYRRDRHQHPHGGFLYEGSFRYVSHRTPLSGPTSFVLRRESAYPSTEPRRIAESPSERYSQSSVHHHQSPATTAAEADRGIATAPRSSRRLARPADGNHS